MNDQTLIRKTLDIFEEISKTNENLAIDGKPIAYVEQFIFDKVESFIEKKAPIEVPLREGESYYGIYNNKLHIVQSTTKLLRKE